MTCSCGYTECGCLTVCHCCQYACWCMYCIHIRLRLRTSCCECGGIGTCPKSRFRAHPHQTSNRTSDKRTNMGRCDPEAAQGSSMASRRYVPETSDSPPRESSTFDESLIFQMDEIDPTPPPKVQTNKVTNAWAKSRVFFQASSHFSSNTSVSHKIQFEQREPQSRVRKCDHQNPDAAGLKWTESPECKKRISNPLQIPDNATGLQLRESQGSKMPVTTQDVAGCSHTNISKLQESHVNERSTEHELGATDLKWTESLESEMMINKDIPGCSYQFNKYVSKQGESRITDDTAYTSSPSTDEYASESLPSNLDFDDSRSSSIRFSPRSPPHRISTSAPARYDLPEPTKLKSSEQKTPVALDTSKTSPTSNLPKFETLRISDSHQIDKSRSIESSSSVEILPENMPNEARQDKFHGQPGIPSNFVAPSQLNSTVIQAESSQTRTPQTLSTSNSVKLPNPEVSKSPKRRTSSESGSPIETISREQANDNSDEAPTNKSQKKEKTDKFNGQPGIPSNFETPQLNSTIIQAEFSQPETSQTLSTSNSVKLPCPEVSKSPKQRTSSESDSSFETISREQANDKSDEAPTNKSQRKEKTDLK